MVKELIGTSLVSIMLILSGCGNGEGESALETQLLLDKGNFNAVIKKVEPRATTNSDYLTLASAYMGKAGFSLTSLVGTISSSANSNAEGYSSFVKSVATTSNTSSLEDIGKALVYYKKVVGNKCTDKNSAVPLASVDADICLYIGLADVSQSAVAISYITDNVATFSNNNTVDDKLTASVCAMEYAFNGTKNNKCTIISNSDTTFIKSQKTYKNISVLVNANSYEYLLTSIPNGSSIITKGYCTLDDFTTRVDVKPLNDNYHVCPISETNSSADFTTESVLITAMNSAFDSIGSAVTADMKKDIDSFKTELLKTSGRTNGINTKITTQDIINYLNDKNK